MQVVLAGNPNAGKTTLFNFLTKSRLKTGNFHGVTTSAAQKTVSGITFTDVPGAYSMTAYSMEENSAIDSIKQADLAVNVIDCLTLENSLNFTKRLISDGKKTVVYLTKYPLLRRRGGWVNEKKLSRYLGVPVYLCSAKQFKAKLKEENYSPPEIKKDSGISLSECYFAGDSNPKKADKLFYSPVFALPFFICAIALMFFLAFYPNMPGAFLKGLIEDGIQVKLADIISAKLTSAPVKSLICEGVLGGAGGVLSFIPQIAILYLFLTLLDESGITSALSFVTDGLFEKVNLSGRAAFSLISGFGCTAAAILTTRGYSTEGAQKRTIAVLPYIPCGAKMPVFLTFLSPFFKNPFPAVLALYFGGIAVSIILSKLLKGEKENLFCEITPISLPDFKAVSIKLYFYLKSFIIKVVTVVFIFCLASWTLSHFTFTFSYVEGEGSMLYYLSVALKPLFYPMGITDWRIAYAALCGFIAKENVAATVGILMPEGLGLNLAASVAMCVFVLLCPACVSAFSASVKEAGLKFTLKCFAVQLVLAFLSAYSVHFIVGIF